MRITFLGTGDSCDPNHLNSSVVVEAGTSSLLLDCGCTTVHKFFSYFPGDFSLDGLWISHFHGDHFLGVPLLLLRFYQVERRRPFMVIGGDGIREKVSALMELAYPGLLQKLPFEMEYTILSSGSVEMNNGMTLKSAPVEHIPGAQGLWIAKDSKKIYYSGDGRPTDASIKIMKNTNLVIHEAYSLDEEHPGHSSILECLELQRSLQLSAMALIHLKRELRLEKDRIQEFLKREKAVNIRFPEDGEYLIL